MIELERDRPAAERKQRPADMNQALVAILAITRWDWILQGQVAPPRDEIVADLGRSA